MDPDLVPLSRALSKALRHDPAWLGIELDTEGWAEIEAVLRGMGSRGLALDRSTLGLIVETNDKQRFAVSSDGLRIRANRGHSVEVDLGLEPRTPPARLYHGTSEAALPSILASGLEPRGRSHVHLSRDIETARRVGARHGRPVVLRVDAAAAHADGVEFRCSVNGVWLATPIAARFLSEG